MRKKTNVEKKVADTLTQLDNVEKVKADPYFYTRLSANLTNVSKNEQTQGAILFGGLLKPAFFVLLLLLNIFTTFTYFTGNSEGNYSREDYLTVFAQDYEIEDDQIYPLSNIEQDE